MHARSHERTRKNPRTHRARAHTCMPLLSIIYTVNASTYPDNNLAYGFRTIMNRGTSGDDIASATDG